MTQQERTPVETKEHYQRVHADSEELRSRLAAEFTERRHHAPYLLGDARRMTIPALKMALSEIDWAEARAHGFVERSA